jgi:hypothetical protein
LNGDTIVEPRATPRVTFGALMPELCLTALFAVLTVPMIVAGLGGTSEAYDEAFYHLPGIYDIADRGARIDFVNLTSAIMPGYHVLMAMVYELSGRHMWAMRAVNVALSMAMVLAVFRIARRYAPPWRVFLLMLPFVLSPYVLGAAIWLTTDNVALLAVCVVLGSLLARRESLGTSFGRGVAVTGAVFLRQVQLWLVGPLVVNAFMQRRTRGFVRLVIECIGGVAVIAVFAVLWGGLVPPKYQAIHQSGFNTAVPIVAVALAGAFCAIVVPRVMYAAASDVRGLMVGVTIGLAALAVPTDFNTDAGRWGGVVWEVVRLGPTVVGRSLVLVAGAALSGMGLLALWHMAERNGRARDALLVFVMLGCCVIAQSANSQAWQRYLEVPLFVPLIWLVAMAIDRSGDRWSVAGPLALAAFQAVRTAYTLYWPALVHAGVR